MEDILGFEDAAAAVVSQRREGAGRWRWGVSKEAGHDGFGLDKGRRVRAQQRTVELEDRDMVDAGNYN